MNCGFIIVIFFTKDGCGFGNKAEYIIFAGECTPLTCKQLSINAKSPFLFLVPDAGTRHLPTPPGGARCRIRKLQNLLRHPALRLPGVHHDQCGARIRDRQIPLAILHGRLLHRHGHGRAAVDTHRPLLRLRTASARTLDQRRGVEGKPAAEPFRRADLGRHPLHDARSPQSQEKLDLQKEYDVRAIQINFADDKIDIPVPGEIKGTKTQPRYIEERDLVTRWKLEGSVDGITYEVIEDKKDAVTDLPHDLIVREEGIKVRYLKLTVYEVPYGQKPCISGLRVFGTGAGEKPGKAEFTVKRSKDGLDMFVTAKAENAIGYNILWGHKEDKLYHSYLVYGNEVDAKRIGALVKDKNYYVRVDTFNEGGITEGDSIKTI